MSNDLQHRTGPPPGRGGGRVSLLLAGVFLGLVVLAGLIVALFGGGRDTPGVPPSTIPPGVITPPDAQLDQTVPTSPPVGVQWQLYQREALPYSASAGPRIIDGAVARGYAHAPTGALIAAVQIGARKLLSPGESWRKVVDQQVVPGPGRDRFTQLRSQITVTPDEPPDPRMGQTTGFRFVTYTPDIAVIQLATKFGDGHMQVTTSTVRWSDGDWKELLQPDGSQSPTVQVIPDLTGFVAWSGV